MLLEGGPKGKISEEEAQKDGIISEEEARQRLADGRATYEAGINGEIKKLRATYRDADGILREGEEIPFEGTV